MRNLVLAFILLGIALPASALVGEPEQKPTASKSTTPKATTTPTRSDRQAKSKPVVLPPPTEESLRFYQAALNENHDMMRLYFSRGADINCLNCGRYQGVTILNELSGNNSWYDKSQVIKFLIANGADLNIPSPIGVTPLMNAASVCNQNHIILLGDNGANANSTDNSGKNVLAYVPLGLLQPCDSRLQLYRYLVSIGADINQQDQNGATPLIYVASRCAVEEIKQLLALGANPNLKTKLGESALTVVEKNAANSSQGSSCNQAYSILAAPERYLPSSVSSTPRPVASSGASIPNQTGTESVSELSAYAGSYAGNYGGDDNGSFQVTVEADGNIRLAGKSLRYNQAFTGTGKMNKDGSLGISLGSTSTGASFQGSINPKTGALYGTWKNGEQAGNFSGTKQTGQTQAAGGNPIEAIGGLLNVLNRALVR